MAQNILYPIDASSSLPPSLEESLHEASCAVDDFTTRMALVSYSDSASDTEPDSGEQDSGEQDADQQRSPRFPRNVDSTIPRSSLPASAPATAPAPSLTALPALPQNFHSLYASSVRTSISDDPSLHSGRVRQTPHIQGNWPTHIYLEWFPSSPEREILNTLITAASVQTTTKADQAAAAPPNASLRLHTLLNSPLSVALPLHISLSQTLTLQTDQKTLFLDTLQSRISNSNFHSFSTRFRNPSDWVPNFDRSRWFLVLRVEEEEKPKGDVLNQLLQVCNEVMAGFGLGRLYDEGRNGRLVENGKGKRTRPAPSSSRALGGPARKRRSGPVVTAQAQEEEVEQQEEWNGKYYAQVNAHADDRPSPFHVSIAWTLCDPTGGIAQVFDSDRDRDRTTPTEAEAEAEAKKEQEAEQGQAKLDLLTPRFDVVKLKIGNVVHEISLSRT